MVIILNMPAIFWKQFAVDGIGNPRRSPPEAEALWTELFGGLWPMPPDNRVYFTFQKHVLLSLPPNQAEDIARSVGLPQQVMPLKSEIRKCEKAKCDFLKYF